MTKADLARKYRDEYGMEMPTLKLARIMYNENPLLFKNVEACRTYLRAIEGKARTLEMKLTHPYPERPRNPYKLPESDEREWEPFTIEESKILVLSDIHAPYHSIKALTAAIEYGESFKPDCILINGDGLDFFNLSKYMKDIKARDIPGELDVFSKIIEVLKKRLTEKIYFKLGNHEERYQHFLIQKAFEIAGLEEYRLDSIIQKRCGSITVIGDKRVVKAGKLNILHGHEFAGGAFSPVNVARGLYLKAKTSAIQGHNHQTSEHTETDLNGEIYTTWSLGCLSELHPRYMPINKWNHGFCTVEVDEIGNYKVQNKRIQNGNIL